MSFEITLPVTSGTLRQKALGFLLLFSAIWVILCQKEYIEHYSRTVVVQQRGTKSTSDPLSIGLEEDIISEKRSLQIANSNNNEDVHILLCCDENDRFPMYTLIQSIILNERYLDRLHFHILVLQNVPLFVEEFTFLFDQYLDSIFVEFKSIINDYPQCISLQEIASKTLPPKQQRNWLNNIMNFARFCVPNVFHHVDIGIYLDVDMVLQHSISTLYDEYYFTDHLYRPHRRYAAWSVLNRSPYRGTFGNEEKTEFINEYLNHNLSVRYPSVAAMPLDFSKIDHLFNAGILMFNLRDWRRHHFTEQSIELFRFNTIYNDHFGRRPWSGVTQPILNMLFVINQIEVGDFGSDWNLVIKDMIKIGKCTKKLDRDKKRILENAKLLHWAGGCKPWVTENANTAYLWLRYVPHKVHLSEWEEYFNVTWN